MLSWNDPKGNHNGIQIAVNGDGKIIGRIGDGGNNEEDIYSTNSIDGEKGWHQIVLVRKESDLLLYIDGKIDNRRQQLISKLEKSYKLYLGRDCGVNKNYNYFAGKIAEVHIYNYALSEKEIENNYQKDFNFLSEQMSFRVSKR